MACKFFFTIQSETISNAAKLYVNENKTQQNQAWTLSLYATELLQFIFAKLKDLKLSY